MASLDGLLAVQELDTRVDQLRHRREHLPERQELASVRGERDAAEGRRTDAEHRLHELRSAQKEAEDHASLIEDKSVAVDKSLYDGSVTAIKELEALQAEYRMLKEHQAQHEDRAIELMEEAEPVEAELELHGASIADLDASIGQIEARITVAEAEIDAEIDAATAERDQAAGDVPAEVLDAYTTLRRQLGGIGAARLVGARCDGCHLEIPSAQLEEVRHAPPDALVTCPECFRILVR